MPESSIVQRRLLLTAALLVTTAPSPARQSTGSEPSSRPATEQAQQDPEPPAQPRSGGGADPSEDAFELGSPPALPEGMAEEQMWPAATAEQWSQPCLVQWQRTFDDALRVARARNMPILACVNMDGEIASEHFAGVRYRDPETTALMNGYVCLVASVYRHTPRDYDAEGRRVECPRFGTVTCGEHIMAEYELYKRYLDGRRIAPRHIVLDLDGRETYDVYYSWDTATVVTTYVKGREGWPEPTEPGERTLPDLARSADVRDRLALEEAYRKGDAETRRTILTTLVAHRVVDQVEVLREALFGFDLEMAHLAREALAQCETDGALDLMAEALKVPLEPADRELLLGAVDRMAESSPRARTLAALHDGLVQRSSLIDEQALRRFAQEYEANVVGHEDLQARADAAQSRPAQAGLQLEFAEAALERALDWPDPRFASLLMEDAHAAARRAERAGVQGPRLEAVLALTEAEVGDRQAAREHAVAAVEGGLLSLEGETQPEAGDAPGMLSEAAKVRLVRLFAEARQRAIRAAYRAGESWPPEWLSDVSAAYAILAADNREGAEPLVEYHDFLRWIGATPRADEVLGQALARFPDSPELHARLRAQQLWKDGPAGLEQEYEQRLARHASAGTDAGQLTWFAGYASVVAAEHYRRRSELASAIESYRRATEHFQRNMERFPEGKDNCLHYVALAHAGLARVALEQGDLVGATDALLECFEVRPNSAASLDGLGLTPVMTARMLQARLRESSDEARATRIQDALDALDPKLLEPPPSELPGAARRGGRRRPRAGEPPPRRGG